MHRFTYAGIGSRATPPDILGVMTRMSGWLARTGWHLTSGGADGADAAFADGAPAGRRTIHLPWRGYNDLDGPDCRPIADHQLADCMKIAARHHQDWFRCSGAIRKLHARNVAMLLGPGLDRPVSAVIAWTIRGGETGGAGMCMRIAKTHGIPVLNLATVSPRTVCERLQVIRTMH